MHEYECESYLDDDCDYINVPIFYVKLRSGHSAWRPSRCEETEPALSEPDPCKESLQRAGSAQVC